jgi:putative solute:sodium symporter small subunit
LLLTLGRLDEREGNKVTTDVPVSDNPARDRHQLRTLILAIATVAGILLAVSLAIAAATYLNQYWFLHFPLGFYLLAQGVLILLIGAAFWFTRMQEHIDHTRSESEELG